MGEMIAFPLLVLTALLPLPPAFSSTTSSQSNSPSPSLGQTSPEVPSTSFHVVSSSFSLRITAVSMLPSTPAADSTSSSSVSPMPSLFSSQKTASSSVTPSSTWLSASASASVAVADACKRNNGGCAHNCIGNGIDYNCSCDLGFELESDRHSCSDFDECNSTSGDHKCAHICINTVGSYACACKPDYKLETDGFACKEEPKKSSPTNKAKSSAEWNWLILGFVIGLIVLNIVILVVGFIAKRKLASKGGKDGIAGGNSLEMAAV